MQAIRKEIHSALLNVSRLCEEFSRRYPEYYPPPSIPYEGYSPIQYGGYSHMPIIHQNPWVPPNSQFSRIQTNKSNEIKKENDSKFKEQKISKAMKFQDTISKKTVIQMKKEQKKLEQLRRLHQKQKQRLQSLKKKKKSRNTLKNQIKKDARYAQKPKFPMSPYFLFLKEKRTDSSLNNSMQTSKLFAEQMGKAWRQMSEEQRAPYVTAYLKEKRTFDEKIQEFYDKYPDLKPKTNYRKEEKMYSFDNPKYQCDTLAIDDQELENDLIDELNSQEDGYIDEKQKQLNTGAVNQQENTQKRKDSLTLSDQKLTSQVFSNSPQNVVEID